MGYRSDVKYVLQFKDNEQCANFASVMKVKDALYAEAVNSWEIKGDRVYFHAEDWKWYEGYAVVAAHEALLEDCGAFGGAYFFLRLGETHDDVDERYSYNEDDSIEPPWDSIAFHRYTEFEY